MAVYAWRLPESRPNENSTIFHHSLRMGGERLAAVTEFSLVGKGIPLVSGVLGGGVHLLCPAQWGSRSSSLACGLYPGSAKRRGNLEDPKVRAEKHRAQATGAGEHFQAAGFLGSFCQAHLMSKEEKEQWEM